jgi:hypothetical protein
VILRRNSRPAVGGLSIPVEHRDWLTLASINMAVRRRIRRDARALRLRRSAVVNAEQATDYRAVSAEASQPSGADVV